MIAKNRKTLVCLFIISLLVSVSGSFVTKSLSDALTQPIKDTQRLIMEEQERIEEQKKLQEQTPSHVTIIHMPDGSKQMTVTAGASLNVAAGSSGEIVRTYMQKLVELKTAKGLYDLWNFTFKTLFEAELALILGLSLTLGTKRILCSKRLFRACKVQRLVRVFR